MNTSGVRRGFVITAALLLVAVAAVGVRHLWLIDAARPVRSGEPLRPLSLRTTNGSSVSMMVRPGHTTLINVFAGWCVPCRDELPALSRAAATLHVQGVDVVGIDQAESSQRARDVALEFHLEYPVYVDDALITQHVFGARVIPETIVVDGDGVVGAVHVGPLSESAFLALARSPQGAQ